MSKRIALLATAALLSGLLVHAGPAGSSPRLARIDPQVLRDTAHGRVGHFLVRLRDSPSAPAARARGLVASLRSEAAATQPSVLAELDALGATHRSFWIVDAIAVEGGRAAVEAMASRPDVAAVETDHAVRVALEHPEQSAPAPARPARGESASAPQWNLGAIDAPAVWAKGDLGKGAVYADADTGVVWDHPALKPQYRGWTGSSASHAYNWHDAIHGDINGNGTNPCGFDSPEPCDDDGHGTHTMGTAVGDDRDQNRVGVAPRAKWIACRNMEQGVGRPSTYIECLEFFVAPTDENGDHPNPDKAPDAIGNSYGCPPEELCTSQSLRDAVDNVRAAGIFMAVAAGNSGPQCSTVSDPPAIYDSSVTVGATDNTDTVASFSSRGPVVVDGSNRRKPDLMAPGVQVRSSYPTPKGGPYVSLNGTSMATPHVGGAVLLLWSAFPDLRGDVDRTEHILEASALHRTTGQGCGGDGPNEVPNNTYGFGRIDVAAAYDVADRLYRPDGKIRLFGGPGFVGDDIYNSTGRHQTIGATASHGEKVRFPVRIQNDGTDHDSIRVKGPASLGGFDTRYLAGQKDVTAAVQAGTYTIELDPGAGRTIELIVEVEGAAGVEGTWRISIRSGTRASRLDVVRARVAVVKG